MSAESHDTLLYSQLQEGVQHDLTRGPAVSEAQTYKELCLAAKNEKHLAELRKWQQYQEPALLSVQHFNKKSADQKGGDWTAQRRPLRQLAPTLPETRQCYICNKPGHLARDCKSTRSKSRGLPIPYKSKQASTRQIQGSQSTGVSTSQQRPDPMEFLYSLDSEDNSWVRVVRVTDGGSVSQCVRLQIQESLCLASLTVEQTSQ